LISKTNRNISFIALRRKAKQLSEKLHCLRRRELIDIIIPQADAQGYQRVAPTGLWFCDDK
jgi:hypothetical protein